MKLIQIRPQHLNMFYEKLSQRNSRQYEYRASAVVDLKKEIRKNGLTMQKVADMGGIAVNTVANACKGEKILRSKAEIIAKVLNKPLTKLFILSHDATPLTNKTILEYHRLISTVFKQADKEMLIPYDPSSKATPPKAKRPKVNYFEIDELNEIMLEVDKLPVKWRTIINLLMVGGMRRAEVCGLKWDAVDFEKKRVHIHVNLLYSPDVGIYEDSTKTESSERYVNLPQETMDLLSEYKKWYEVLY